MVAFDGNVNFNENIIKKQHVFTDMLTYFYFILLFIYWKDIITYKQSVIFKI